MTVRMLLPYAKAVAAGITALVGALGTASADGRIEPQEIAGIVATVVIATAAVWGVPNRSADERP